MTLSSLLTSACRAARCAARSLRTRSSNDSGTAFWDMPGGGRRELVGFGFVGDAVAGDDFVLACGVLAVNRVASATVRGVLSAAIFVIRPHTHTMMVVVVVVVVAQAVCELCSYVLSGGGRKLSECRRW